MKKFRQVTYTFLLLITCLIASPMIFKQIWNNSKEKAPSSNSAPTAVDVRSKIENSTQENSADGEKSHEDKKPPKEEKTDKNSETTTSSNEEGSAEENAETKTTEIPDIGFIEADDTYLYHALPDVEFIEVDDTYFDDALFIGDSRTVGISEYGTLKNADYFCSVGLAAYKADTEVVNGKTLNDVLSASNYGKIYVMLGINEVGNNLDSVVSSYEELVKMLREKQPDAVIYIMANLHVTQLAQTSAINNENINALNERISAFADNKNIVYLDINPVFDDENGNLRSDCSSDGVHVYAKYYLDWCDWLCLHTVRH